MLGPILLQATGECQTTIRTPQTVEGIAAFEKCRARVTFLPAEPNTGIAFLIDGVEIPARSKFLARSSRFAHTTVLEHRGKQVVTVEHVLAAVTGLGITNLRIAVFSNGHIPFSDGSSSEFCETLIRAQVIQQDGFFKKVLRATGSIHLRIGSSEVLLRPSNSNSLSIEAILEFPNLPIGHQEFTYAHSPLAYCLCVAWARTFAYRPFTSLAHTLAKLPGFRLSRRRSSIDSNMIIWNEGKYITRLRRNDEPVRHKVLDFIGDVTLLGAPLLGTVNLVRPGHSLSHALIQYIDAALICSDTHPYFCSQANTKGGGLDGPPLLA
jgi:UDP-3-O-[3-hydroxymyristoyl] N-acetylglucosamine deacetylase